MDNGHARERVGGAAASSGAVCGWAGEADLGDAGEGEEVRGTARPTGRGEERSGLRGL